MKPTPLLPALRRATGRGACPGRLRPRRTAPPPRQRAIQAGRRRRPARSSNPEEGMINHSIRVMRRPRRPRPPAARAAAAIIAAAALALLAAACGGSPSSTGSRGSSTAGRPASSRIGGRERPAVAFTRCMRSHGVPDFPDPSRAEGSSNANPARSNCRSAAPSSLRPRTPASALLPVTGLDDQFPRPRCRSCCASMLPFARCMRSRGVPNFPDPAAYSEGRPTAPLNLPTASAGIIRIRDEPRTVIHRCQHSPHDLEAWSG